LVSDIDLQSSGALVSDHIDLTIELLLELAAFFAFGLKVVIINSSDWGLGVRTLIVSFCLEIVLQSDLSYNLFIFDLLHRRIRSCIADGCPSLG